MRGVVVVVVVVVLGKLPLDCRESPSVINTHNGGYGQALLTLLGHVDTEKFSDSLLDGELYPC
jgi:hypothetical protein